MTKTLVYLIDDDEDDRDIFALALEGAHPQATFRAAKSGREALDSLNNEARPNFIFIDLNMPHMSGRECLEEIKKRPMLKDVPAIVYTTSSHAKDIDELLKLGAEHYIVKPNSIVRLTEILRDLLKGDAMPYLIADPA